MTAKKDELTDGINKLMVTIYQSGMLNAVKEVTELLEADEQAGVPISMQRVIAHLRATATKAETSLPPEQLS